MKAFLSVTKQERIPPQTEVMSPNLAVTRAFAMDTSLRRRRSPADRSDSVREKAEQFLALPDVGLTGQASEGVVANPFWSDRARAEQELQQMRPDRPMLAVQQAALWS